MAKKLIEEKVEKKEKPFNIKDYKDQIDKYIKERVEIESASQSVKLLKKQLHSKKVSSAIKSFIILCLLGCIGYGVYYLYDDGYFEENKGIKCPVNNCAKPVINPDNKEDKPTEKKEVKVSQEELIEKYGNLVENIIFDANSNYTNGYYKGDLTTDIKLNLAYNLINKELITVEDGSLYFEAADLEKAYKKLFADDVELQSFKYNNAQFSYFASKGLFISNTLPNESKEISREILEITLEDDNVVITCVEGYINNGKLYNIVNNKEVKGYSDGAKLAKYKDKLNVIKYTFNNEYLVSLSK